MSIDTSGQKKIAKNTFYLYIRMLFSMVVSLYTSRVVLEALGVVDYGIYGVVGGVVSLWSFINSSMSTASSRFLTIELGKHQESRLSLVFNMSFYCHACISLVIFFIAETIGLWFLNSWLVIPADRMYAASWVFQMSILAMMISVTQVPYRASIISHEKMGVFAFIEIINIILKLAAVFLLIQIGSDKLITYSILIFLITCVVSIMYRAYCRINFKECKLKCLWDLSIFKQMIVFSGWDLFGNLSVVARGQGVNILLNMFFGPVINAASSVAGQAGAAIMAFAANVTTAAKPQIFKTYAQLEFKKMSDIIHLAVRVNLLILAALSIPLLMEMDFVLSLWLKKVPAFAGVFCSLILLFNFFASASNIVVTGIHATGNLKRMTITNGTIYLMVIPISYLAFMMNGPVWIPFLFNAVAVSIGMLLNAYLVSTRVTDFSFIKFIINDVGRCVIVIMASFFLCSIAQLYMEEGYVRLCVLIMLNFFIVLSLGLWFVLPKQFFFSLSRKIYQVCLNH